MESSSLNRDIANQTNISSDASGHESWIKKWGSLVVLSLALAIIIIDTTLLNVSIGTIIRDLNTDIQSIQWVITAYALILAAFTITGGRLGDLFGRKRMFVLGAIIFAIGSYVASISKSVGPLIWGEAIIEGIGAALMMPATSSLLVSNFKGRDRAIAFGVWGGIAAASSAIGPILGGFLTTHYSWRWGFRINIFVAALVLLGAFLIKEAKNVQKKTGLDIIGVILSSLGLLSMVFGFIKASDYGWFKAKEQLTVFNYTLDLGTLSVVPLFVVLGLLILAGFVGWERYVERKGRTPLVSLSLFKNRQFVSGAGTMAIQSLGLSGMIFAIPVFLQAVRGLDPFDTGLAMLPLSVTLLVVSPLSVLISRKISPTRLVQIGLLINAIGFVVLQYSLRVDTTAADLIPGFAIFGLGMGFVMAQVSNLTLSAVPVSDAGEASGVNNTLRQVGSTLGSAIIGTILLSALTTNLINGITGSSKIPQNLKPSITDAVSKQVSSVEFGGGVVVNNAIPQEVNQEILDISHKATTDANRTALAYGGIFAFLGFVTSLFIPKVATTHAKETPQDVPVSSDELSIATAVVPSRKVLSGRTKSRTAAVGIILTIVVFAGLGAFAYTQWNKNAPTPLPPPPRVAIDPQPAENGVVPPPVNLLPPPSQTPPAAPVPPQPVINPPAPVMVPPPTKPTPSPGAPKPEPKTTLFSNAHFGVSFTIPASWQYVRGSESGENLVVYNERTGEQYGVITKFSSFGETLDTVAQQLESSPNIIKTAPANFQNLPAIKFWSVNGQGIVFMKNGSLYYLTDHLTQDSVLKTLKFS